MAEDHRREKGQRIRSQERTTRFPQLGNAERRGFPGSRYGVAGAAHSGMRPSDVVVKTPAMAQLSEAETEVSGDRRNRGEA